jgi:hypothetical protein
MKVKMVIMMVEENMVHVLRMKKMAKTISNQITTN